jgi:PAS domain S-box-containing protein
MTHRSDQPCETAEHPCPLEEMQRTKQPAVVEHLHYDEYGHPRHVEIHSYPIFDGEGNVSQAIEYSLDITERKRVKEALEQSERELTIRNKIANVFLTASEEEMYEQVLQIILEAMESRYGVFGYIDEAGDMVAPSMTKDIWDECQIPDKDIVFPRETWGGIWGRAMVERKILYSNGPFRVPEGHIPMLRAMAVPIVHQGELIGLIAIANKVTDYDEKDRELLESIVDYIAPVLRARLQRDIEEGARRQTQEALRQHAERLETQHQIDQAILAAESPESIAQAALGYMRQLVPYLRASVTVFDFEAGEMSLLGVYADAETQLEQGWRGPLEWALFIEELRQGEVHEVEDLQLLSPRSPLTELLQAEGVRCYMSVPLVADDELRGSLNVGMDSPGRFTPEQMDIVCETASQVAVAIRQARLHEQVHRHADELEVRVAERTAALRRSEARFRVLFEEAALGIALVDMEGRLVESNPALQRMLGYSGEELRGLVLTEFIHKDDVTASLDLYRELMAGRRSQYTTETRYTRRNGQTVWANVIVSLVRGTVGQPRFRQAGRFAGPRDQ